MYLLIGNADIAGSYGDEMVCFQFGDRAVIRPYADANLISNAGIGNCYRVLCLLSVIGNPVIHDIDHEFCTWIVEERMVITERRLKKLAADRVQDLITHLAVLFHTL